jgi:isocitrate/isopropylmalate dehydrogenase
MRDEMKLYVNSCPIRCFNRPRIVGVDAAHLDWFFVRENSEGEYSGYGGRSRLTQSWEVGTELSIFTRYGVERIMKYAFQAAMRRNRKHLTVVSKSNALRHGLVHWHEIAAEVAADFPEVTWDKKPVDAMKIRMAQNNVFLIIVEARLLMG